MSPKRGLALVGAATLLLSVAACASDPTPDESGLPPALQGNLVNPILIYPPYGFIDDDGEYSGINTEFAAEIADRLGVALTDEEAVWENMLSGVQSGKYIWFLSAEITAERLEVYDWVWVDNAFANFITAADGADFTELDELCGSTVGALSASTQASALLELSDECVEDGQAPVEVQEYKDFAASVLAVQSGQADYFTADSLSAQDLAANDDTIKVTGPRFTENPLGIALQKGNGVAGSSRTPSTR